jgi:hypothetical protein
MDTQNDRLVNQCAQSFYADNQESFAQDTQAYDPTSPLRSQSDTSSYSTGDFNHIVPFLETPYADGDIYTDYTDRWRDSERFSNMDLELSGMVGQTWHTQRYPSSHPQRSHPAPHEWMTVHEPKGVVNSEWVPEHDERRIPTFASLYEPRYEDHSSGPAYDAPHHFTITHGLSERSMNSLPAALPVYNGPNEGLQVGLESLNSLVISNGAQMDTLDSNYSMDYGDYTIDGNSWSELEERDAFPFLGMDDVGQCGPSNCIARDSRARASNEDRPKVACSHPGCNVKFSHHADLTRHLKSIHNEAGKSYRCAFKGCSKYDKVWTRLDSFKKHVTNQHPDTDVESLVQSSCRDHHDLPVSVTTPRLMSQQRHSNHARSTSLLPKSVTL